MATNALRTATGGTLNSATNAAAITDNTALSLHSIGCAAPRAIVLRKNTVTGLTFNAAAAFTNSVVLATSDGFSCGLSALILAKTIANGFLLGGHDSNALQLAGPNGDFDHFGVTTKVVRLKTSGIVLSTTSVDGFDAFSLGNFSRALSSLFKSNNVIGSRTVLTALAVNTNGGGTSDHFVKKISNTVGIVGANAKQRI